MFQGESSIIGVTLKSGGVEIDPSLDTLTDIEIRLLNRVSGQVVAKYSREEKTGFTQFEIDNNKCICYCPYSVMSKRHIGNYDIQVNVITPNSNLPGGNVEIQKGSLLNLLTASDG